ncbi:MAG: chemotaxis protein CheA [Sphingobium sp.]
MDELLEQFLIEGRDLIAQASADLTALARDPADRAALDGLFRAIHTLKGSVALFDMAPAERMLHAAESLLDGVRKGQAAADTALTDALVACIDQTDRWIEEMERTGALGDDAGRDADRVVAGFTGEVAAAATAPLVGPVATPDWTSDLLVRERAAVADVSGPLIAFRYTPDADCFFRGEDPLAVAAGVPDLLALAISPRDGAWPDAATIEPFACFSVVEGLSSAPIDAVRTAFRLVSDQVVLVEVQQLSAAPAAPERVARDVLRVDAARVDALADGLGGLLVAINALAPLAEKAGQVDRTLAAAIRTVQAGIERAATDLHASVDAVRSVPLEPALRRLPRLAREIAADAGKSVSLTIIGEGLEVDRQIADGLFEPLVHLLRNAIDHGIEPPEKRISAGKPPEGSVTLRFARDGDMIVAVLADDGGGIDPDMIRAKAAARGLMTADAADALDDGAALRLIFLPGFSTAETVTELSGRGVGMDAVRMAVERMRGTIAIDSRPGEGTQFHLRFPASALTTRLLVVEAGGDRYGVALDQVVETVRVDAGALLPIGGGTACVLRGRTVPVLSLAALLGRTERETAPAKLLVTRASGEAVALRVDGFAERIDMLVRPPVGMLAAVPGVGGSALMGDGAVLLVLDLPGLVA